MDYFFVQRNDSEKHLAAAAEKPMNLKTHSLRYEEIIRRKKEELRKKRNLDQI